MKMLTPAPLPTPRKPGGGGVVVVFFLLLLASAGVGVYWFLLRDPDATPTTATPSAEVAHDASTAAPTADALPDLLFTRPPYASAEWVDTSDSLVVVESVVETEDVEFTVWADYGRLVYRVDAGGALAVDGKPQTLVLTPTHRYTPGTVFGLPWTRVPRPESNGLLEVDDREYLALYQDVVTADVRADATNVSTTEEVLRDVPVTTYRFDVDVRLLGGQMTRDIDPGTLLDDDTAVGSVRVSIDSDGMIRMYEVRLPAETVRPRVEAAGEGAKVTVELRREITNISSEPLTIEVPLNAVDA